jgi:hypothetical protein
LSQGGRKLQCKASNNIHLCGHLQCLIMSLKELVTAESAWDELLPLLSPSKWHLDLLEKLQLPGFRCECRGRSLRVSTTAKNECLRVSSRRQRWLSLSPSLPFCERWWWVERRSRRARAACREACERSVCQRAGGHQQTKCAPASALQAVHAFFAPTLSLPATLPSCSVVIGCFHPLSRSRQCCGAGLRSRPTPKAS